MAPWMNDTKMEWTKNEQDENRMKQEWTTQKQNSPRRKKKKNEKGNLVCILLQENSMVGAIFWIWEVEEKKSRLVYT